MEDLNRLVILYDYYGDFLTEKQREIFDLYYFNDLSLGEIAEITGITRQGVYDMVRRSSETLKAFENTLGMVEKQGKLESKIRALIKELNQLEPYVSDEGKSILQQIYRSVNLLLKEGGE